ncbi:MAG: hypothetical protein R3D62_11005 [Xanthobacteraceae bacterium]
MKPVVVGNFARADAAVVLRLAAFGVLAVRETCGHTGTMMRLSLQSRTAGAG